jgi:filamentous hemagglutinin family protein
MKSLNHIYRTIWSEALGAWIAVSEITKAKGKRSVSNLLRVIQVEGSVAGSDHGARLKPILFAVACCFAFNAQANPMGGAVVNGQASFNTSGNTLTVTNTPGTIINWQGFSINANEVTRFAQQSASSTVLNRVVTNNPSVILGTLSSNGQVYLVNANGIMFGAGSTVDVAGLVATSLNLSNADFLAGRHNYTAVPGAQNVSNAGNINAQQGGQIYLIAPNVENSGIITAPNGEILLTAGNSVQLVNSLDPNLRVSITAPAGNATNLGKLIVESGSLGLFGTMVKNSGSVSADSAVAQGGKIVFKASQNTQVGGTVSATGTTGGNIEILGNQVALLANANVDASGVNGGGTVLVGGDAHGTNPNVQNAQFTNVDATATIKADATQNGNGGKVVVWSDNTTQFNGNISAQGGVFSGNGGWVEVSGKQKLSYAGLTNTLAPNGIIGTLLLDPADFIIAATGGDMTGATLSANLGAGNVTIITALTGGTVGLVNGGVNGDIIVNDVVTKTTGAATTLTLNSFGNIAINAPITSTGVGGTLNLALNPGAAAGVQTATISANVDTNGGTLVVGGSGNLIINAGTTTLNSANTFNNLTLTGTGVLTGSGAININNGNGTTAGIFNWTGGTLSGTGTFSTTPGSSPLAGFKPTATTMNGTLTLSRPFNNLGVMSQGAGALTLTVTPLGSLTNTPTAGVSGGTLILGNGATGGTLIVNGILLNLGGLGAAGTGVSSVDASGATIGTITNNGIVGVTAGSTLNWMAGVAQTNTGTWGIGSATPTVVPGGVLNLGVVAGGGAQTYSGAFTNVGTVNVNSGTNTITGAFTNNGSLQFGTAAAGTNSYNGAYSEAQLAGGFAPTITFASGTNSFNSTVAVPLINSLSVNGGVNNFDLSTSITGLNLSGGTLTGLGSITVPTAGGFNWINGTLATTGVGVNAATLILSAGSTTTLGQAASTLNLSRALTNSGTVSIQNVNGGGWTTTMNIGAGGSFTNNGTFNLGNAVAGANTVNVSDTGTFTNGATGIINSAGAVTNAIQAALGLSTVGTITNSGAINVAAGNTLNYLGGQTSTNAGAFTTAAGGVLNLGTGVGAPVATYNFAGALTNAGALNFLGSGNSLNTGASLTGAGTVTIPVGSALTVAGGTVSAPLINNGSATFSFSAGSYTGAYSGTGALTLDVNGGAFSFAPTFAGGYIFPSITYTNLGNLNFDVNATIANLNLQGSSFRGAGAITIAPGGTLTVAGTVLGGFSALTVSAGATANFSNARISRPVTNLGTMNVTGFSVISTIPSTAGFNNGSLTNGATGVLNLNSGYLQSQTSGFFTNNTGGQVIALTGYNTIDATGSMFTPTQVGIITNNGSIAVNAGATLVMTDGFSSTNSGTYTNAVGGTLSFNKAAGATAAATYTYTNANALTNNGTASVTGTNMGNITNTGALTLSTATVNGSLTNSGTGTVTTAGTSTVSGAITNSSTTANSFNVAALTTLNSTTGVTNNAGGTFTLAGILAGPMTNAGTLNQTGTLTGALINSGTASVSGTTIGNVTNTGALTLSTATVNGTLANNGTGTVTTAGTSTVSGAITNSSTTANSFNVAALTTLNSTTGVTNNAGGTFALAGILVGPMTNAGSLNQTGTLTGALINSGTARVGGTTTGNVTNTGALTLSTATVNGTLANNGTGTMTTAGASTVSGAITNASTAVNGFNVATGTTLAATSFTNAGTLAGGGTLNLGTGTLTNNGIIAPGGVGTVGTLSIIGNLVMGTTGAVSVDLNSPSAGNFDVLNVSGTATLAGGTLNIAGTGSAGSYTVLNAGSIVGTFTTINAGSFISTPTYAATMLGVMISAPIVIAPIVIAPPITPQLLSELMNATNDMGNKKDRLTAVRDVLAANGANLQSGQPVLVCQ